MSPKPSGGERLAWTRLAGPSLSNMDLADLLEQAAELLTLQHANPYRVRAYRNAAVTLRAQPRRAADILADEGREGLDRLPAIGRSLSATLEEILHTGRFPLLDRLMGEISPEDLFTTLPGIGEDLAHRLCRDLEIETLEDLELAAHDGRLAAVKGFGRRRCEMIRDALAARLSRSTRRRARLIGTRHGPAPPPPRPQVEIILAVDALYRERAARGELRTIAPRRFNPEHAAWLPILHEDRDGWSCTALYSNTARAHELGKTRDWVVVFYEHNGDEGQCTVVTERQGPLAGRRVVRGREDECARLALPG